MDKERDNELEDWQDAHPAKTEAECEYAHFAFEAGWAARQRTATQRVERLLKRNGIGGLH